jgi:hypothetical protein
MLAETCEGLTARTSTQQGRRVASEARGGPIPSSSFQVTDEVERELSSVPPRKTGLCELGTLFSQRRSSPSPTRAWPEILSASGSQGVNPPGASLPAKARARLAQLPHRRETGTGRITLSLDVRWHGMTAGKAASCAGVGPEPECSVAIGPWTRSCGSARLNF